MEVFRLSRAIHGKKLSGKGASAQGGDGIVLELKLYIHLLIDLWP